MALMISGKGEVRNAEGVITGYQVVLTENNPLTVIPAFIPQDISKMEDDMIIRLAMEEHYRKYFPDKAKTEAIQQVTVIEEKVAELDQVINEAKVATEENKTKVQEVIAEFTRIKSETNLSQGALLELTETVFDHESRLLLIEGGGDLVESTETEVGGGE